MATLGSVDIVGVVLVGILRLRLAINRRRSVLEYGNRGKQFTTMANEADTELLEIVSGQFAQSLSVYRVVFKGCSILTKSQAAQPAGNIHRGLPHKESSR